MIAFSKYHGAGNDFIMLNDLSGDFTTLEHKHFIAFACHRQLGVGADGLIFVRKNADGVLKMVYYNADGEPSSFCGNGSRCFLRFCVDINAIKLDEEISFEANDGLHTGTVKSNGQVIVSMRIDAQIQELLNGDYVLDTGSPHYIKWVNEPKQGSIDAEALPIRHDQQFKPGGINVNFVAAKTIDTLQIRTFERGVEAETLACGTGVTAAAIAHAIKHNLHGDLEIAVLALGGNLSVRFELVPPSVVKNVCLIGPAVHVFSGQLVYA